MIKKLMLHYAFVYSKILLIKHAMMLVIYFINLSSSVYLRDGH